MEPKPGLFFLLCVGAGLTAFAVWGRAAFPALAAASSRAAEGNSTWRSFWVGLVNAVTAFLLFALFAKIGEALPPLRILALGILVLAALVIFRGILGLWPSCGHLILAAEGASSDLQATLAGGALLTGFLVFFPVGTLFFLYMLIRSLGVGVLQWVESRGKRAQEAIPA
jgi:hypothetical protein